MNIINCVSYTVFLRALRVRNVPTIVLEVPTRIFPSLFIAKYSPETFYRYLLPTHIFGFTNKMWRSFQWYDTWLLLKQVYLAVLRLVL